MMDEAIAKKVITTDEAITTSEYERRNGKKVVLVGGCFDILHVGHRAFLSSAKKQGDLLFVLLESDAHIRELKGEGRPFNTQTDRAKALAALSMVDYIVTLPAMNKNSEYDSLIFAIGPAIIATTKADPSREHKERQANHLGIEVYDVIDRIPNQSTSEIAQLQQKEI